MVPLFSSCSSSPGWRRPPAFMTVGVFAIGLVAVAAGGCAESRRAEPGAGVGDEDDDDDDDDRPRPPRPRDAGTDAGDEECPAECPDVDFAIVAVPGCCAGPRCGVDLAEGTPFPVTGILPGLSPAPGCVSLNAPGNPRSSCPTLVEVTGRGLAIPTLPEPLDFSGCCRGDDGDCGFLVDLGAIGAPSLGCAPYSLFEDTGSPMRCADR